MAIYVKNPKCPKCGAELDIDDTLDFNYDDEWLSLKQVGSCPACGTYYQWDTNYPIGAPHHDNIKEC